DAEILAPDTGSRLRSKQLPARFEAIEKPICSPGIALGDIEPDVDEIFLGARGLANLRSHLCPRSNRRRASALISSIEPKRPGPLSNPSCARLRSSASVYP